jgi:hypothetical protein
MNYVQKAVQSGAGMFELLRILKTLTLSLTRASNWGVGELGATCPLRSCPISPAKQLGLPSLGC